MRRTCWSILFIFTISFGQTQIPTDYFANPMDITMSLSGNFGELRANHFHSGLDIRTQQREGLPVYASADGYVSRINVQHFGYGKAVYLMHPNGYTTVYAHLQRFAGKIQEYVKSNQYQKESFEIELFPEASLLPVKKGDLIAYSGNTGGSGGPHLHFEIRDGSQRPMNPMLFGINVPDNRPPVVDAVFVYPIGEDAQVNHSQEPSKLRLIKQKDGNYKTENVIAYGRIGFGVSVFDRLDGAANKNGAYSVETFLNNTTKFKVRFDKFSFSETRYKNRYTDYEQYRTNRIQIHKLFREANNPLSIIVQEDDNGYVVANDSLDYSYQILVKDFKGNDVRVIIPIQGKKMELQKPRGIQETDDYIFSDHASSITKGKFSIYIPANSLYENVFLDIKVNSDTLKFHTDIVPIHKNISITADISNYLEEDKNRLYIGRLDYRGQPWYTPSSRKGDRLTARTRLFGDYVIASDSTVPRIQPLNFSDGKWISNQPNLRIKITDGESGISSYRGTINGKFILMEYDYKTNVLTYDFEDAVNSETENNLKLIVIDNVGNSTTFEAKFFRK